MQKLFQLTCLLLSLLFSSPVHAADKITDQQLLEENVNKTIFEIGDYGRLVFILPAELMAQDKFSGTVLYKPSGNTETKRKENLEKIKQDG